MSPKEDLIARLDSARKNAMALGYRRGIRWLFSGILLLFSVMFLSGILWRYWPTLANYPWKFDLWPALVGCLVYTAALLVVVLVWSLLLQHLGASLHFREHLRIYCLTFVAMRIPGAPWHVAGRVVLYKQRGIDASVASVAAGLELLLAMISGLVTGLLIWFVLPESMQRQLIWLVIVLIFALALIHPRVTRGVLKWLGYAEGNIRLRYQDMLFFLVLYLIVWSMDGVVLYSITRTLYPIPFGLLPAVTGAWALSGAISLLAFISPSSLGLREIALSVLLGLFIPPALAVIVAILARLLLTGTELLWAIVASRA